MPPTVGSMMPKTPPPSAQTVRPRTVSILGTLGLLALVASGLAFGLLYAYAQYMSSSIAAARDTLAASEKQFEPELIAELTVLDKQMIIAKKLMDKHVQISPILKMLDEKTLSTVQFDEFSYELGNEKTVPTLKMKGQSRTYRTIAQQSTVFSNDARVREHIFSDFKVNEGGKVEFQLKLIPSPDVIYFSKWYESQAKDNALLPDFSQIDTTPIANQTYIPSPDAMPIANTPLPVVDPAAAANPTPTPIPTPSNPPANNPAAADSF